MEEDITSLAHTKRRCQYHLVGTHKYRRKIIYGKYRAAIVVYSYCFFAVCTVYTKTALIMDYVVCRNAVFAAVFGCVQLLVGFNKKRKVA